MGKYIKAAFANRWNLLALAAGVGVAIISGSADVLLPIVAAAEVAYLGFVGTHPKFQNYVNVTQAAGRREAASGDSQQTAHKILEGLPPASRERFKQLRSRLLELRQIASDLKRPGLAGVGTSLDSMQLEQLDKLLWIFLRLLFTKYSLERFFDRTDLVPIHADIQRLEKRLAGLDKDKSDEKQESRHAQKIRSTLEDNLATSRSRLANYEKAKANYEYVELELDRLENKIKSLAELSVNRQEPDFITSQVNQVAGSVLETEKTINDLDFVTGLAPEEEPPELLRQTMYMMD